MAEPADRPMAATNAEHGPGSSDIPFPAVAAGPYATAVSEVAGDFEIHITAYEQHADKLAALAAERGVKFLHIVLDRGSYPSQPMLTLTGRGSLAEQHATVQRWKHEL